MPASAALVPIKGFHVGKSRLASVLDDPARELLARTMAEQVITAAAPLDVHVATDDERVGAWAIARGCRLVWTDGLDLNGSIAAGLQFLRDQGYRTLVVAHADLPFADALSPVTWFAPTIVPDRRDDGTNVLCIPADLEFEPMYGPGSFQRHLRQLRALGTDVRVARRASLQWDVDVPDDLPGSLSPVTVPA